MFKVKILFLSPQEPALRAMAEGRLKKTGTDLFTVGSVEVGHGLEHLKKYDLVVTLSKEIPPIPSSVRHVHWPISLHESPQNIADEITLWIQELIQTYRSPTTQKVPLKDRDWGKYYQEENTAWDLGEPSPPFVRLFKKGVLKKGKMAVPGCGKGHEVLFFAKENFEVTAIDFAKEALQIVQEKLQKASLKAKLLQKDFLCLDPEEDGRYDYILEQTCYCAIEPVKRGNYVRAAHRLLRPHGELIGLFYDIDNADGPPFGTSRDNVLKRFSPFFKIESLEKSVFSHERRKGKEWLGRFIKRD
jgi:SAM-dependent methyltransferase